VGRLAAVAACFLLLACPIAAASPLPQHPPKGDANICANKTVTSRALWFHASDGVVLAGAEYGSGAKGVVLAPESRGSHCSWLPFARVLAAHGYHVFAFDLRGLGQSPAFSTRTALRYDFDLIGAVRELHTLGAKHVVAAGASLGGASVLAAGPALAKLASGLVDFSGEPSLLNGFAAVPKITLPILVVGSKSDAYAPTQTSRWVMSHVGSADKQLLLEPGQEHGWDIVQAAPYAAKARATVLAWLAHHG
jgi:pimeloyl-ACP methyl ester carboxylesterase